MADFGAFSAYRPGMLILGESFATVTLDDGVSGYRNTLVLTTATPTSF